MAVERLPGAIGVMFGIQMQHDACDVAPKATVRRCPRYFRFTPESRHSSQGLACLKGAKSRRMQCSKLRRQTVYSITSSARARSDGGTVMPSAFAVLMLITSSNLVGA